FGRSSSSPFETRLSHATPPGLRVRTGRFEELRLCGQPGTPSWPKFLPTVGHPSAVAVRFEQDGLLSTGLSPAGQRSCWAHPKEKGSSACRSLSLDLRKRHGTWPPAAFSPLGVFISRQPRP